MAAASITTEESHGKWKMLPRRRHSIQNVQTSKSPLNKELLDGADSELANEDEQRQIGLPSKQTTTRRPSLAESLQSMTKTVSNSFQKAFGSDKHLYDDKNKLNKSFLKEVFSLYYNQPDLKITKLNVKLLNESDCVQHYPTSTVTDLLMNLESSHKCDLLNATVDAEDIDPKSLYYGAIYEVEAWIKYGKIRRKLDLVAKCHPKKTSGKKRGSLELEIQEENEDEEESVLHLTASQERLFEADRDYIAHDTVVQDMCAYLRKKGINNPEEMLSLPVRFRSDHLTKTIPLSEVNETKVAMLDSSGIEAETEAFYKNLFLIQDLYGSGYRMADVGPDENGLDFTHSLLATAKLATFHAVSYCMRRDEDADFCLRYPFLNEDPVYRPATKELFTTAQNSLAKRLHSIILQQNESPLGAHLSSDQGRYFEECVKNLFEYQSRFVDPKATHDKFNVLCHGDLWMQNVVFSYGSCLESQSDVVDVRFDDLHHARYASCATDIHNLLYYTVDADIRRDHTVNLLAVYHDHFSKTVKTLSPSLAVFSQSELLMEFHRLLPFGFLEGLTLFSTAYETQLRKKEAEDRKHEAVDPQDSTWSGSSMKTRLGPKYSDYRDTVLSLMADVSRLKFQGVIPGAPTGLNLNIVEPSGGGNGIKCSDQELKSKKETEKVLVTSL